MDPREYALGWLQSVIEEIDVERVVASANPDPSAQDRAEAYGNAIEHIEEAMRKILTGAG